MPVITGTHGEFEGCYQVAIARVNYTNANLWEIQTIDKHTVVDGLRCSGFEFWGPIHGPHIANITLDAIMTQPAHANFI